MELVDLKQPHLCFTQDYDPDKARIRFMALCGQPPAWCEVLDGYLRLGPVRNRGWQFPKFCSLCWREITQFDQTIQTENGEIHLRCLP